MALPRPSRSAGAGRLGDVSPLLPQTPAPLPPIPHPTPPLPFPTTSNPREMQRPGFFFFLGCSESLSEQGLTCWSGDRCLSLRGCGLTSASPAFLPDRRVRQQVVITVAENSAISYLIIMLIFSLLLVIAVISFLQLRKLLSYSGPRPQRVQRGCIALSLSRGFVF